MVVFGKQLVVNVHQFALANRGDRLFAGHVLRFFTQAELAHADRLRARADQHQFPPAVFDVGKHFDQCFDTADVEQAARMGEGGGTDLDHHPLDVGKIAHIYTFFLVSSGSDSSGAGGCFSTSRLSTRCSSTSWTVTVSGP